MTTLTIRNVDRRLKELLRIRAARHGRSMEAELRDILAATLDERTETAPNLAEAIHRLFAPYGGLDLEPPARTPGRAPPCFDP